MKCIDRFCGEKIDPGTPTFVMLFYYAMGWIMFGMALWITGTGIAEESIAKLAFGGMGSAFSGVALWDNLFGKDK